MPKCKDEVFERMIRESTHDGKCPWCRKLKGHRRDCAVILGYVYRRIIRTDNLPEIKENKDRKLPFMVMAGLRQIKGGRNGSQGKSGDGN